MCDTISYSVAIRTLGTAGNKYRKLMNSIASLKIPPEKIVVVLPKGSEFHDIIIGNEQFVYSEKGMISQRIEALKYITSKYTLFCDDDVEFESDFVEKLMEPLEKQGYAVSAGPLLEFFPPSGIKAGVISLLGGACVMIHGKKDNYVRLLKTGGWSYNRAIDLERHRIYNTQSVAGTCFLAGTEIMKRMKFSNEMWAEKVGYSAFEDRIMIGKMIVNGYRACVVSDALYKHNDGKTSVNSLKLEPQYAAAFNHYVFWHRFVYLPEMSLVKRVWSKICIKYYIGMGKLYHRIAHRKSTETYDTVCKGFADAKRFIHSKEYLSLPSAII